MKWRGFAPPHYPSREPDTQARNDTKTWKMYLINGLPVVCYLYLVRCDVAYDCVAESEQDGW